MSARTAAIVLHWRSVDEAMEALESAGTGARRADLFIVVDHRGEPLDLQRLRARFPGIVVLEPGKNLGPAGGSNLAIAEALARGCSRVLLLNDDARLLPDTLARLEAALDANPGAGIAAPLILFAGEPERVWFGGGRIDWRSGATAHLHVGAPPSEVPTGAPRVTDYFPGCVLLVNASLIGAIGAFDERYFIYFEETDWCERARRAGFRLLFVPEARALHRVSGGDTYAANPPKIYYFTRNRLLFMQRYREGGLDARFHLAFARYLARVAWGIARRGGRRRLRSMRALVLGLRDFRAGRFGERTDV